MKYLPWAWHKYNAVNITSAQANRRAIRHETRVCYSATKWSSLRPVRNKIIAYPGHYKFFLLTS